MFIVYPAGQVHSVLGGGYAVNRYLVVCNVRKIHSVKFSHIIIIRFIEICIYFNVEVKD